jgi:deazaflavin-dependent oxidoreductase (nitroreductase family)
MPVGRKIARFNKVVTNRTVGLLGPWMPGFGVVIHKGRNSGRTYRTPVNLFRTGQGYLLALTFGSDADWVKNVLAADSFEVITQRRTYRLVDPKLFVDELRSQVPFIVRLILNRAKGQCPDIMPPGIIMVWSMDRPQLVIRFAIGWCMFWKAPATSG